MSPWWLGGGDADVRAWRHLPESIGLLILVGIRFSAPLVLLLSNPSSLVLLAASRAGDNVVIMHPA